MTAIDAPGAPADGQARDEQRAQFIMLAVGVGLLFIAWRLFLTPHAIRAIYERDMPAYQGAIDAFAKGLDPYLPAQARRAHGLPFIAPPFVWMLYNLAAHSWLRPIFGNLLMIADFAANLAIPVILSRLLLGPGVARVVLGTGVYFAALMGSGVFTLLIANNGTPLYALIALGLIPAVRDGRWLAFHLAVALATAFKPFYAAFWLIPLLADAQARAQWRTALVAVALAAASYAAPLLLAPRLMREWLQTLLTQVVGRDRLGDNLLGAVTADPHHAPLAPIAAHVVLSAILLVGALRLGRMSRTQRIASLLMIAVFLNPRAMQYDLCIAAIPLVVMAAGALSRGRPNALIQAVAALGMTVITSVFCKAEPTDGYIYAAVAVVTLLGSIVAVEARPAAPDATTA